MKKKASRKTNLSGAVLEAGEERYRLLVESTEDSVYLVSRDCHFLFMNRKCLERYGLQEGNVLGRSYADFHSEEESAKFSKIIARVFKEKKSLMHEYLSKRDGRYFLRTYSPVFGHGGEVTSVSVISKDISELIKAQKSLASERNQLLSICDSFEHAVYVSDPSTYEILFANKALKMLFNNKLEGKICYKEFQRKQAPCEFCTNEIILKNRYEPYFWEFHNPVLQKDFLIMDRIIKWPDGRDVRLEFAIDVTEKKNLERAIRESEEKFRGLVECINDVFFIVDKKGILTYISPSVEQVLYYQPEELIGKSFLKVLYPEDAGWIEKRFSRLLEGEIKPSEYRVVRKDGEIRWVRTSSRPYCLNGVVAGVRGSLADITEEKKAEEEIRKNEELLRSTLDGMIEGCQIISPDWRYLYLNDVAARHGKRDKRELLGRKMMEVYPGIENTEIFSFLRRCMEERTAHHIENEFLFPDGSKRVFELRIQAVPQGILIFSSDITERKRAEKELQQMKELTENIIHNMSEGIVMSDAQGSIIFVNPVFEEMSGYRKEELLGKSELLLIPEDQHHLIKAANERRARGERDRYELRLRKKDGEEMIVLVSGSPLFDEGGRFSGTLAVMTDLTEVKLTEKKLNESLREKEALLKEIHHRVKNNMQVISSMLQLQSHYLKDHEAREMFKECQERIRSMALVHEKLYRSKDYSRVEFSEYLKSLAVFLFHSNKIDSNRISLKTDLENINLDIHLAIPCGLIVNELLSNSLKHAFPSGREGVIELGLHRVQDGHVLLRVSDDGIKFPEDLDFRKTETLGMQIVVTLVEQIEGKIELSREKGTEFRIIFPSVKNG